MGKVLFDCKYPNGETFKLQYGNVKPVMYFYHNGEVQNTICPSELLKIAEYDKVRAENKSLAKLCGFI